MGQSEHRVTLEFCKFENETHWLFKKILKKKKEKAKHNKYKPGTALVKGSLLHIMIKYNQENHVLNIR